MESETNNSSNQGIKKLAGQDLAVMQTSNDALMTKV